MLSVVLQRQQNMATGFIFQQDGAPPHFLREVTASLSRGTCLDWTRRTNNVATMVTRYYSSGLPPMRIREIRVCWQRSLFQQFCISYVHGSHMQLHKLMQMCLGRYGMKQLTGGTFPSDTRSHNEHLWLKFYNNLYQWIPLVVASLFCFFLFFSY
jgi:hypothetical protein